MVLMAFKKQERAKPGDAISLALHYFIKRIILKAWEISFTIDENWVELPWVPKQINQKVHHLRGSLFTSTPGSAVFSTFPSAFKCFWI